MHAMLRIGDSTIMLCDDFPQWGSLGPKALRARRSTCICMSRMWTRP